MEILGRKYKVIVFVLSFFVLQMPTGQCQEPNKIFGDTWRDVTTISVAGVGGAILGLSTLSFVEEPKDHMSNIVIGAAIGVIIGVGFVAWKAATTGKQYYHENGHVPEFTTTDRLAWHHHHFYSDKSTVKSGPKWVNFNFNF